MRRETMFNAARRIKRNIEDSGLSVMFDKGLEAMRHGGKDNSRTWVSFEVFQRYSLLINDYGDAEKHILKIFGIELLSTPLFWSQLSEEEDTGEILYSTIKKIRFACEFLPKIMTLIEQDYVEQLKNPDAGMPHVLSGKSLLTVILVEDEGQFSSPTRLVYVLDAVSSLYHVVAILEGQADMDLSVLSCDSGSDKSFDFLGLAKLMEEVRKIVLSIWDRRVFHRQMHISQCMTLIAESLPIIERIHLLKESGAIGPEQAELLKRKTIDGATKFMESGALISEMERETAQSPRLLMRPEPKLLTSPKESDTPTQSTASPSDHFKPTNTGEMTSEEIEELERLVSKAKSNQKKPRPTRKKDD